jgi:hypothetical protein
MEFPRMLLRVGTAVELDSGRYDWRIVSEAEYQQAIADGWHLDQYAAKDADSHPADLNASGEVTRQEMEAKAKELGLKFDGRTSEKRLMSMIDEAVK